MRVDHNSSSVDAGAIPLECQPPMVAVVRRRGLPCRGRRVGVPLIADLDLADGFDSARTPERLETIGYLAVTEPRTTPAVAGGVWRPASGCEVIR